LAILIVLVTAAIFVWLPKSKKTQEDRGQKTEDRRQRTEDRGQKTEDRRQKTDNLTSDFRLLTSDWGRNPFAWPKGEEEVGGISGLALSCIIWNDEGTQAVIDRAIVRVGDKIGDKTVKRIEQNRVILTEGTKDYVLELQE
jgi:hypothetical protein